MPYLELRNQTYRIVIRHNGKKVSRSLQTKDKKQAEIRLAQIKDGLNRINLGKNIKLCFSDRLPCPSFYVFSVISEAISACNGSTGSFFIRPLCYTSDSATALIFGFSEDTFSVSHSKSYDLKDLVDYRSVKRP
ncbi:MAG: hypothetical protein AAF623_05455 [Planctomycetota bacterium]